MFDPNPEGGVRSLLDPGAAQINCFQRVAHLVLSRYARQPDFGAELLLGRSPIDCSVLTELLGEHRANHVSRLERQLGRLVVQRRFDHDQPVVQGTDSEIDALGQVGLIEGGLDIFAGGSREESHLRLQTAGEVESWLELPESQRNQRRDQEDQGQRCVEAAAADKVDHDRAPPGDRAPSVSSRTPKGDSPRTSPVLAAMVRKLRVTKMTVTKLNPVPTSSARANDLIRF